jgi:hypothetical protein
MSPAGDVIAFPTHPKIRPKDKAKTRPKPKGKGGKARNVTAAAHRANGRKRTRRYRENQKALEVQQVRDVTAVAPEPALSPVPQAAACDVTPLGLLTVLSLAVAVGAYSVLYGVLEPLYHGTGAALRALVPLAVEMIAGYAAHQFAAGKVAFPAGLRALFTCAAVAVILACGWTELDAARAAPVVAARERAGNVLEDARKAVQAQGKVTTTDPPASEGRHGQYEHEKNQGKAVDLAAAQLGALNQLTQQQLNNAGKTSAEEGRLPTELALLGALGSSCFIPLLEAVLRALGRRGKGGAT